MNLNLDSKIQHQKQWFETNNYETDPIHPYAYCAGAFTPAECERIIQIGNKRNPTRAETLVDSGDYRDSEVSWLNPYSDLGWINDRLEKIIVDSNKNYFHFDIFGTVEQYQFCKYSAPGGKYKKHIDSTYGGLIRKLSFTLQLSPSEDYDGGELCLYYGDYPEICPREQGFVVIFPSYVLHEVRPVTRGTRYSLVSWITGRPFK